MTDALIFRMSGQCFTLLKLPAELGLATIVLIGFSALTRLGIICAMTRDSSSSFFRVTIRSFAFGEGKIAQVQWDANACGASVD
jgi:hypothetical protein